MTSGCKAAVGCVDARVPVRASYVNLYKWPESDVEFVKSVARRRDNKSVYSDGNSSAGVGSRSWAPRPVVADSYSCRQMYLRSYTFSKKESVPERTRRCLDKVKERASLFQQRRESSGSVGSIASIDISEKIKKKRQKKKKKKKKKKNKGCAVAIKRLRDASCSALYSIFHRLLSCTTSIDVVDGQPPR